MKRVSGLMMIFFLSEAAEWLAMKGGGLTNH
jgi:hypothetical protein